MNKEDKNSGKLTRAFICIEFPDEVIKEVARVQELLGKWNFIGKMTELENLHLTLKFLGEIDDLKIGEIKNALREIKFGKFEAKLNEIGIFNYSGNPKIVWIKVGRKEIFELQKKVDEAMEKTGFKKEERFMSHVTIARIKYVKNKEGFERHVKNMKAKEIKFKVERFFLKKSELKPNGPVYENIDEDILI